MHIELIGSTCAGKTTLAKKMVQVGKKKGLDISLSDDFMLEHLHLSWVQHDFIRRRLIEAIAFAICLTQLAKYQDFIRFVIRESRSSPGSWFYKVNRIRNVIRKIGIFEFISRRRGLLQIVLADNEGILQGLHNLFVHQHSQVDLHKIALYVELVPLPDAVLYIQQEEDVLVSRTLARGHARVAGGSPDEVAHFIRQAVAVFDELMSIPKIQERSMIVDQVLNAQSEPDDTLVINFHHITESAQSGH